MFFVTKNMKALIVYEKKIDSTKSHIEARFRGKGYKQICN
jgi:hypothetical protein